MRRIDLISGTKDVVDALQESNVQAALRGMLRVPHSIDVPRDTAAQMFHSLKSYSLHAARFSNPAKVIAQILGLTELENPTFWSAMLLSEKERDQVYAAHDNIHTALEFLPKIITLLEEGSHGIVGEAVRHESRIENLGLLSVIIIEEGDKLSTPARLVTVLQSVNGLYETCAVITGGDSDPLTVVACDSGSDKSFDFLGAAKVIECVKDLLLSMWDRVVYFRERKVHERLQLVAESLPIMERIASMQENGSLAPEQAELLRRGVAKGVEQFLQSGAITPEINRSSSYDPRRLMAPEPKLLARPDISSDTRLEAEHSSPVDDRTYTRDPQDQRAEMPQTGTLSPEEQDILEQLLKKLGRSSEPEAE